MHRTFAVVVALVACVAVANPKHPNPFLSQAKVFFAQGDGEKCLKRAVQAEKWKFNDKKDKAEMELYGGLCACLTGDTAAAEVSFKRAVKLNPKVALPADINLVMAQTWSKATGKKVKGMPTAPVKANAEVATAAPEPTEPVVAPTAASTSSATETTSAAEVAPVAQARRAPEAKETRLTPDLRDDGAPPIVETTTVKKGKPVVAPVLLGIGALASAGVATYFGLTAKSLNTQFNDPNTFQADADRIGGQAKTYALITNIGFGLAGAFALSALAVLIFG